jgi:hypothetical protein
MNNTVDIGIKQIKNETVSKEMILSGGVNIGYVKYVPNLNPSN